MSISDWSDAAQEQNKKQEISCKIEKTSLKGKKSKTKNIDTFSFQHTNGLQSDIRMEYSAHCN